MPRGGDTSAKAKANGKKSGRPEKPKIEQFADKGIATTILGMDGAPDHRRKCECNTCASEKKLCDCQYLDSGEGEPKIKTECRFCVVRAEHAVCHCEICGWWELLTTRDKRIVHDTRKYLTDRRDGKPAMGMFVGDTREHQQPLTRGDAPSYFRTNQSSRPN